MAECDDRDRRRSARRITAACFPREKWLQDCDDAAIPHSHLMAAHLSSTACREPDRSIQPA